MEEKIITQYENFKNYGEFRKWLKSIRYIAYHNQNFPCPHCLWMQLKENGDIEIIVHKEKFVL